MDTFDYDEKYYRLQDIFMVIAFMALGRIETINRLDSVAPGEWGRLMGIDRIPEKKALREKLDEVSSDLKKLDNWIGERAQQWIQTSGNEIIGRFFLDGHVRTYFGNQKLPYRYVARQKLCMRGLTDYWVNDAVGNPFFSVTSPFTKGLIAALKEDILPKLTTLIPQQSQEDIDNDIPLFTMIFDREGYSMTLFKELWKEHRIACQTYHKFPKEDWPESEFKVHKEETVFGTTVEMKIAEKFISPIKDFELREVRFIAEDNHQVTILTRDFRPSTHEVITHMKSRLSQENFFRYGRQEFNLDTLASYKKVDVNETINVTNPKYRKLDHDVKSLSSKIGRRLLEQKKLSLPESPTDAQQMKFEAKQGDLTDKIEEYDAKLTEKKAERKATDKHIQFKDLPEDHKFQTLHGGRKKMIDVIKMICYRAEVAMANIIVPNMSIYDRDTARTIIKNIFQTSADIHPDYENNKLTVLLHHMNNRKADVMVRILMKELNKSEFNYPGTELTLEYKFVSD